MSLALAQLLNLSQQELMNAAGSQCPNPINTAQIPRDCSFYPNCLESKFNCGPSGYPMGYGYKYCNKFLQTYDHYDDRGKQWIDRTLVCLKNSLVKDALNTGPETCDQLLTHAFDSHVPCYTQNGFCGLAFNLGNPRQEAGFIAALMRTYDVSDFASFIAIKQVFNTITTCGWSALQITNLSCFSGIRSFFRVNDIGEMYLIPSNDIAEFDLLEHPEYLEDEFHHGDMFRVQPDHQEYEAFGHMRHYEDHHGGGHHYDLHGSYTSDHYVESAGHGSTPYSQPIRYKEHYKYVDARGMAHEQHGHQVEHDHHDVYHDYPVHGDEEHPTHHYDEHFWIDPYAKTPEEQHKSEYYWTSDHHYIPETEHEHHQRDDPDDWGHSEVHLVDIVEPMQHYYSDPIHSEELHLQKPIHYEADLYVNPETHHETMLVQPIHHDPAYSIQNPHHDLYDTIEPAHHYDEHYHHMESHQEPVHHYDDEYPHRDFDPLHDHFHFDIHDGHHDFDHHDDYHDFDHHDDYHDFDHHDDHHHFDVHDYDYHHGPHDDDYHYEPYVDQYHESYDQPVHHSFDFEDSHEIDHEEEYEDHDYWDSEYDYHEMENLPQSHDPYAEKDIWDSEHVDHHHGSEYLHEFLDLDHDVQSDFRHHSIFHDPEHHESHFPEHEYHESLHLQPVYQDDAHSDHEHDIHSSDHRDFHEDYHHQQHEDEHESSHYHHDAYHKPYPSELHVEWLDIQHPGEEHEWIYLQ